LLLLAQTVQNFSLKLSFGFGGGCSPGFCVWPFDVAGGCRSSAPSRPIVVVSGSVSGGGGGGGGCARRRGSVDMIVLYGWLGVEALLYT
jgi:hypothetical protein